jgi:hypothetical protein
MVKIWVSWSSAPDLCWYVVIQAKPCVSSCWRIKSKVVCIDWDMMSCRQRGNGVASSKSMLVLSAERERSGKCGVGGCSGSGGCYENLKKLFGGIAYSTANVALQFLIK